MSCKIAPLFALILGSLYLQRPPQRSCNPYIDPLCLLLSEIMVQVVAPTSLLSLPPVFRKAHLPISAHVTPYILYFCYRSLDSAHRIYFFYYGLPNRLFWCFFCQMITELGFQNWVMFNFVMDDTHFHNTKILTSSPFWLGADVQRK